MGDRLQSVCREDDEGTPGRPEPQPLWPWPDSCLALAEGTWGHGRLLRAVGTRSSGVGQFCRRGRRTLRAKHTTNHFATQRVWFRMESFPFG